MTCLLILSFSLFHKKEKSGAWTVLVTLPGTEEIDARCANLEMPLSHRVLSLLIATNLISFPFFGFW